MVKAKQLREVLAMSGKTAAIVTLVAMMIAVAGCGGGEQDKAESTRVNANLQSARVAIPANGGCLGDMDGDGEPSVGDAIGILRIVVGLDVDKPVADVNRNGAADVGDAILVLRCVVGLDSWPICGTRMYGICYGPFRDGQSPGGEYPSEQEIREDLSIISACVTSIRTFGTWRILEDIPRWAHEAGLTCMAGAWLDTDQATNDEEVDRLIAIGKAGYAEVLCVGGEVLLRGDLTEAELIEHIRRVKREVPGVPVTTNDGWWSLVQHPDVVAECDFVCANFYPFWGEVEIGAALQSLEGTYDATVATFPGKEIVIGETGWPSAGDDLGQAEPTAENQALYLSQFIAWAEARNVRYYFFEAFDEAWKTAEPSRVGPHWGLWRSDRSMKPAVLGVFCTPPVNGG